MKPVKSVIKGTSIPAPVGGLNTVDVGASLPPTDCVVLKNRLATENGLRSRMGYRVITSNTNGDPIRSLIPFKGSLVDGSNDRLWAVTWEGMWDITNGTWPLTQAAYLNFSNSGWGSVSSMTTIAGNFLFYTDHGRIFESFAWDGAGMRMYTESTDAWSAPAITGVSITNLVHCCSFKNRMWFAGADTADAWYLGVGAISGSATRFSFGNKSRRGGVLVGLWNMTLDGGAGVDDHLVGILSSGDVIIYKGTDPDTAGQFELAGVWNVGDLPKGRRIATDYGGDLLILSSKGVVPLSTLVRGEEMLAEDKYATYKIRNLFSRTMSEVKNQDGWDIQIHPQENALIILVPKNGNVSDAKQFVSSLATKGWAEYEGLDMTCCTIWNGKFYFGTSDGRVCVSEGYSDEVTGDDPVGSMVDWQIITSFQNLENLNTKRIQSIRPRFAGAAPAFDLEARYNFDDHLDTGILDNGNFDQSGARFGTAIFGTSRFGGDIDNSGAWVGSEGNGTYMAVSIRGQSDNRDILVALDVLYDEGGLR